MVDVSATGYSGTPLAQKLGLKDGQRALFIALPPSAERVSGCRDISRKWRRRGGRLGRMAMRAMTSSTASPPRVSRARKTNARNRLMESIARAGTIWISWPKKASKVATDITEDVIRDVVLPIGLVDVKVAAVDAISGRASNWLFARNSDEDSCYGRRWSHFGGAHGMPALAAAALGRAEGRVLQDLHAASTSSNDRALRLQARMRCDQADRCRISPPS